jgi:hypothetical protein
MIFLKGFTPSGFVSYSSGFGLLRRCSAVFLMLLVF